MTSTVAYLDLAITIALAPWFIFPNLAITPWLMLAPPVLWLVRWSVTGSPTATTPLNPALGLMLLALGVSVRASYDVTLSFPKIAGVYYGIVLAVALCNHLQGRWMVRAVAMTLFGAGVTIAAAGLLGTRWIGSAKLPLLGALLDRIYALLPDVLHGLPRAEEGFSSNQVGGTLAFLVPLQAALWLHAGRHPTIKSRLAQIGAGLGVALTVMVLILTLSRAAIATTTGVLGLLCLAVMAGKMEAPCHRRLPRWPKLGLTGGVLAMIAITVAFVPAMENDGAIDVVNSLSGRVEIWQRAWTALRDHPYTGIGFDTLPPVVHARYPTARIPQDRDFTHAHNLFLQTALDLGIPGLIAFTALLLAASARLAAIAARRRGTLEGTLALGLVLGLVAYALYGMTDAIALGQKPALLIWVYLGLAGAINKRENARAPRPV